jgi:hypothetical protein
MRENEDRALAGSFVVDGLITKTGWDIDKVGYGMVESYLNHGYGEREDIRSTVVDMVADVAHFVVSENGNFENVFEAAKSVTDEEGVTHSPSVETQSAIAIAALRVFATRKGYNFDDIMLTAANHVEDEVRAQKKPR